MFKKYGGGGGGLTTAYAYNYVSRSVWRIQAVRVLISQEII